jgi:N-acetylgalactosamine-6-sulfatase
MDIMRSVHYFLIPFLMGVPSACKHMPLTHQPNVILIVADDLGYGDLGCYGCTDIKTPNIDKLAEQGARLTNFYANGPECTPTRAALLSGGYQQRIGGLECAIGAGNVGRYDEAVWLWEQKELGLPTEYAVLPSSLKRKGYHTALMGKWHLGYEEKFRPDRQGFDYSIGPIGYGGDYFYHVEQSPINLPDFTGAHNLAENGKEIFRDGEYMTELITVEAVNWLHQQHRKGPFFLYLPFTSPHSPYQGPGDDPGRPISGEEWNDQSRQKYIEMVEAMDRGIGEILYTLELLNLDNRTMVIFFSDNGGTRTASNGILSGFKGQVYEGGIRVPCLIRWPEMIRGHTVSDQVSISFDLSHSILNVAGMKPERLKTDGYDILSHISRDQQDIDRTLYWRAKRGNIVRKAIRDGDDKYLIEIRNDSILYEKLFNLADDPSELDDLFHTQPGKVTSLKGKMLAWEEEIAASRLKSFRSVNMER